MLHESPSDFSSLRSMSFSSSGSEELRCSLDTLDAVISAFDGVDSCYPYQSPTQCDFPINLRSPVVGGDGHMTSFQRGSISPPSVQTFTLRPTSRYTTEMDFQSDDDAVASGLGSELESTTMTPSVKMTPVVSDGGQYRPPPLPSPLSSSAPAPVRQHSHSATPSKRPTVPKRDPTTQLSTVFPDGLSPKVPGPNSPRRSMECGQLPPSPEPPQISLVTTSSTVLPSADQSVPPVSDIIRRFDQAKLHTDGISRTSPPIPNCRFPSPPLGFCSDNSTHEPSFQKNMASREPDYPNRSSYASQFIPSPPISSSQMPSRACLSSGSPPLRSPTSPSSQMMSEWNFSQFNEVVGKLVPCSPPPPSHPSSVLISANSLETNSHHRQVTLHSMQLDPSTLNTLLEYNITDPYQIPDFQPITHGQAVWKQHKLERKNREAAVAYAANLRKWDKVPTWKRELIEKRQITKPLTPTTPHRDQHHEQQQPDMHSLISAELTAKLQRRLEIVNAVSESSPSSQ